MNVYREGQRKFTETINDYIMKGCEWIDLDAQNFKLSIAKYQQDKDKAQEIQKADAEVRLSLEDAPIDEDDTIYIKACKFKFKRDMDMYRKLEQLKFTTAPAQ